MALQRYRITTQTADRAESTRVILPDLPSAETQAREIAVREKGTRVRVYFERYGEEKARELVLDLGPGSG